MHSTHTQSGSIMNMAVTKMADTARYGGVVVENEQVIGFFEKGKTGQDWINAGLYVLNRALPWPSSLPSRFSFEEHVRAPHVRDWKPAAFCHTGFLP
jgi:NDP-sugar pyrophosphorylase family protein